MSSDSHCVRSCFAPEERDSKDSKCEFVLSL